MLKELLYNIYTFCYYLKLIFKSINKSLLNLLQEYPQGVSQNICKSLLFQLCKAIEKCHSLEIIHRGLFITIKL